MYRLKVQRREKEKVSRYIQEASAPAAVTVYQICNMSPAHVLYICISTVEWQVTRGGTGIPADLHAVILEVFYIFRAFLSFSLYYSLCTRLPPSYRNNCKGILSVVLNYEFGTCL